ncbi:MAG: hypothetical protein EXS10_05420 [Phycisphaerales bacterium]|nr:hypothetical protein [Phycisphaerales bacterium]
MSKMFYSLSEAAQKLGKSEAAVLSMSDKGLIQKNMHEGQVKFRVEQIDLLADGEPVLGKTGGPIGLADSGSGSPINVSTPTSSSSLLEESSIGLADTGAAGSSMGKRSLANEDSGVSIFSSGKGGARGGVEIGLESVGSGSGLLDLTRESEETALGAELIEGVYGSDAANDLPPPGASGIFEPVGGSGSFGGGMQGGATFQPAIEIYDGAWSGVGIGLMTAAVVGLVCVAVSALAIGTGGSSQLATFFAENMLVWVGGLAGVTAVFGVLGFFLGRATE